MHLLTMLSLTNNRMQEPSEAGDAELCAKVNRAINTPMGEHRAHVMLWGGGFSWADKQAQSLPRLVTNCFVVQPHPQLLMTVSIYLLLGVLTHCLTTLTHCSSQSL